MRTIKAHNKSKAPPKISIDEDTSISIFCDFKMSLFKLKSPGFLNRKIYTLQIFKNSGWMRRIFMILIYI